MDRNRKLLIKRLTVTIIMAVLLLGNGFSLGFWMATGESPISMLRQGESYAPPANVQSVDLVELTDILAEDDTSEEVYREGYNCVDYAWEVMRILQWEGIDSGIIAITFEDGGSHAILIVPTEDKGWQFIDPQSDKVVDPHIGGYYNGKRIEKIEVMVLEWIDIIEFTGNPAFGGEE